MDNNKIIQRINELKQQNSKTLGKYRRNYRRYNFTPYSSMENIKDSDVVGWAQSNYSDLTDVPSLNVIKSCIDTLVSKISQSKVRPFFNVVQGSWKDIRVVRSSQEFFDLFYDEQNVSSKISNAFRDACIFDTGVIYIDEVNKNIERALPWQVWTRSSEVTYGKLTRVYYERKDYPTCLLKARVEDEYCTYGLYYDTLDKVKVTVINGKITKKEPYDKDVLPFVFIHYSDPISGSSSMSVVDTLCSIQTEINVIMTKISEASQLNPALTYFVPEGSTIKAGQLNNRVGNILTYKPLPNMSGSPVSVSTPACIDNQYINLLNELIQKAYEMVGVTQLSAQGAKPVGIDSGAAIQTLENVESERFEVQLSNVIKTFVDVAKVCIKVFNSNDNILPQDKNRVQIKWKDIVEEADKMFIQFSAGDKLGKDPATKAELITNLASNGFIPSSRVAQLLQIPDLESTYTLATNSLNAVMTVIDNCIEKDVYDIPDFIPYQLLKEEILNAQLSLFACGKDGSNNEDIEKLQTLYNNVCNTEISNSEMAEAADMTNTDEDINNGRIEQQNTGTF